QGTHGDLRGFLRQDPRRLSRADGKRQPRPGPAFLSAFGLWCGHAMRSVLGFPPLVVLPGLAIAVALACSSSGSPGGVAPVSGAGPLQAIGAPCSPTLNEPCIPITDVCSISLCDPTSLTCLHVAVDGGPTCTNGSPPPPPCDDCDAGDGGDGGDG